MPKSFLFHHLQRSASHDLDWTKIQITDSGVWSDSQAQIDFDLLGHPTFGFLPQYLDERVRPHLDLLALVYLKHVDHADGIDPNDAFFAACSASVGAAQKHERLAEFDEMFSYLSGPITFPGFFFHLLDVFCTKHHVRLRLDTQAFEDCLF